ncbi:transcription factor tau subunit sfc1 isoform X2 [Carica papaya]|nr:transcription factor tau subunit sfc1 isoform X2 [Carica papaya]XP_021889164.1 transcription factor tau subunit sfc1 isoform X2 [Carica papaya]
MLDSMGVIKEGKVSGTLPCNEVFAVHYPGHPSSTSRAIETLGGTEGIMMVRTSQSNKLELHFRPEDPYSHPALGELRPSHSFLLKISRKKYFDSESAKVRRFAGPTNLGSEQLACEPERDSVTGDKELEAELRDEDQTKICADIVARVSEAYYFDGMADYQHVIPVHADIALRKKRSWIEMDEPLAVGKGGLIDLDKEDVMMLLPPFFAPKDVPENLVLRPPATLGSKRKQEGTVQNFYEIDMGPGLAIDFNVKEIPKKVNWEVFIIQGSEQWKWQVAISELFNERPIWSKEALTQHLLDRGLTFSHHMLNRLMLRVAYYFSTGPFRRFWIRKGYDPRKDPDSRIYQRTEFRVPKELRSYCDANLSNGLKHRWEDICAFRVFPYKCQTHLQLFELDDDYIRQEIRKPPKQTTCDLKTGWFSECMLDTLRLRVAVRFLSIYPKDGVEEILRSTTEEFEKSNKACIYKYVLKPCQGGNQQNNRENEDKEKPEGVNDMGDEIEVDEDEEELDEYEELDLAEDYDEISLPSHSFLDMENNSRTYLQELFGSFPASDVGVDKILDADTGDEEYQIYEQDSDDSFSSDGDGDGDNENDDDGDS